MPSWAASNLALRAERDAMDEVKRRAATAARTGRHSDVPAAGGRPGADDCGCASGVVCRRNANCPRRPTAITGA